MYFTSGKKTELDFVLFKTSLYVEIPLSDCPFNRSFSIRISCNEFHGGLDGQLLQFVTFAYKY